MFVVWGTTKKVKRLGFAADFCGICRDLRCVRIDRIGAASHVYGLSVGSGQLVGHLSTCTECKSARPVEPGIYAELAPRPADDPNELLAKTYPRFEEVYGERLALEAMLRAGKPMPEEAREALLREPFLQLEPEVDAVCSGSSRIDRETMIAIVAMIALPIGVGAAVSAMFADEPGSSPGGMAALIAFGVGLLGFFYCLSTSPARWVRRRVLPRLARALHPLQPKIEEIENLHRQLKTLGLRIAKKLSPAKIEAAIASSEFDPLAPTQYDYRQAPRLEEMSPTR